MIKLKVENKNGRARETKVLADGVDISQFISTVIWRADCDEGISVAWLRCPAVEVEVEGELRDITTLPDLSRRIITQTLTDEYAKDLAEFIDSTKQQLDDEARV